MNTAPQDRMNVTIDNYNKNNNQRLASTCIECGYPMDYPGTKPAIDDNGDPIHQGCLDIIMRKNNEMRYRFLLIPDKDIPTEVYPGDIQPGCYNSNEIVELLREYKNDPEVIAFIADMLEE